MNFQRFTAPTAREAMALARTVFGDDTLILSNRQLDHGVEVVAAAQASLAAFEKRSAAATVAAPAARAQAVPAPTAQAPQQPASAESRAVVEADVAELAMSTLSFQDYVRERMMRRQHEEAQAEAPKPQPAARPVETFVPAAPAVKAQCAAAQPAAIEPLWPEPEFIAAPVVATAPVAETQSGVMAELQAMRELMETRFNALAWIGTARQDAVQSNLMLKLIRAGYSPALARKVLEPIKARTDASTVVREMMATLERMLAIDPERPSLVDQGGVYALVGATGVGKTTTAAKIAAQCARVHGPSSVGLITLDTQRVGAHDQLRAHGRNIGVVAHLAHDRAALQELLALFQGKRLVVVDTAGFAPRDLRRRELLDMLELPSVTRLMVFNAGTHGDTLDDMATCFKVGGARQAILTKTDEAVKLGPALDTMIRHNLVLRGIGNGQRIAHDWKAANAGELVRDSMRAAQRAPFDPASAELDLYFSPGACTV